MRRQHKKFRRIFFLFFILATGHYSLITVFASSDGITVTQEVTAAPIGGGVAEPPPPAPSQEPVPEPQPQPELVESSDPTTPSNDGAEPAPEQMPEPVGSSDSTAPSDDGAEPAPGDFSPSGEIPGIGIIETILPSAVADTFARFTQGAADAVRKSVRVVSDNAVVIADRAAAVAQTTINSTESAVKSPAGKAITAVAEPLGAVVGIAAITAQTFAATASINSLADVYFVLVRFLGFAIGVFRRKHRPWGTVYDAVTKRPLDPAYVVLKRVDGTETSDAITDLDGRYGFLLPPGTYVLEANKTHYQFPSKKLAGKTSDELYDNLYFGAPLVTHEGEVITKNIPLDPIGFDWNEFAKNKQQLFRIYSSRERIRNRIFHFFYILGFSAALITTLLDLRPFNFIFLLLYAVLVLYQFFVLPKHKAVVLRYASGEPIPYALVHVMLAGVERPVKSVVSDHLGRFYVLVSPGEYYVRVEEKQPDSSYREIYRSGSMNLLRGVMSGDMIIPKPENHIMLSNHG